jgi:hypothetical protein
MLNGSPRGILNTPAWTRRAMTRDSPRYLPGTSEHAETLGRRKTAAQMHAAGRFTEN